MNYKIFYFLFISAFCLSCGSNSSQKPANPIQDQPENKVSQAEKGTALSILEYRLKNSDGKTVPIIEADTWEYKFVFKGSTMSKEGDFNGQWIDFKNDHTYVYGTNEQTNGSGRYFYSLENANVLMVDDDPEKKAQEYDAKFAGDVMVLVGTPTYDDNSVQMKLERIPDSTFPH